MGNGLLIICKKKKAGMVLLSDLPFPLSFCSVGICIIARIYRFYSRGRGWAEPTKGNPYNILFVIQKNIKNVWNFFTWLYFKWKDIFDNNKIINSTAKSYISISYQEDLFSKDTRIFTASKMGLTCENNTYTGWAIKLRF